MKVHKNDRRDAQGIAECAARPSTSSVAIKSETQLDIQALHRVRERLIKERTAIGNELRGILAERGYVMRKGAKALRERVMELGSSPGRLSDLCRTLMLDLYEQWCERDGAIERYDKQLKCIGKQDEQCRPTADGAGDRHHQCDFAQLLRRQCRAIQERSPLQCLAGPGPQTTLNGRKAVAAGDQQAWKQDRT